MRAFALEEFILYLLSTYCIFVFYKVKLKIMCSFFPFEYDDVFENHHGVENVPKMLMVIKELLSFDVS